MKLSHHGIPPLELEIKQAVFTSLNIFNNDFEKRLQQIVESLFQGNAIFKQLKSIYKKYDAMIEEIGAEIDAAWERILESARDDMFDRLEEDGEAEWRGEVYTDPYDIDMQDMFDYYNEEEDSNFFLDWFRQEISHNLENKDLFKKYIGDSNSIPWDHLASQGHPGHDTDYIIHKETDEELRDQLNMTISNIEEVFKKIKAEIVLPNNKQLIFDLVFTDKDRINKEDWQEV